MKKSVPNILLKSIPLPICILAYHGCCSAQNVKPADSIETTKLFTSVKINSQIMDSFIVSQNLGSDQAVAITEFYIRVSQSRELIKLLPSGKPEWFEESITDAMNSGNEKWVAQNEPVTVYTTYFTARVGNIRELNFREDIYGHDRKLARHLLGFPSI